MRRYIILLLITGIVWAQTEFDKLVLKDGTTYLGEYSNTEKEMVYFKPQNAFAFQTPEFDKLVEYALNYYQDFVLPHKMYLKINSNNRAIFEDIINLFKKFSEQNGAKFYFIYVPEINRYLNGGSNIQDSSKNYEKVIIHTKKSIFFVRGFFNFRKNRIIYQAIK